ncbi:hypothetical protein L1987_56600 [Smallanthus sonchifolius]|uniref:Uncharacterized protein n=1 Tax=Smallanthus sonchifolius TaxID=185202 RepID=A0ACB9EEA9_9ASTR|nr:hypothetical protein L1987_56600 [Smallanthus sonchifolius]
MTTDSSTATINPSADGGNTLPSPWAQVVRVGIEPNSISLIPSPKVSERLPVFSDPVESPPERSDAGNYLRPHLLTEPGPLMPQG